MFKIRRIYDCNIPATQKAVFNVQTILKEQFPLINQKDIDLLPDKLKNLLKYKFKTILFIAENIKGETVGFALLMHAPDVDFTYLERFRKAPFSKPKRRKKPLSIGFSKTRKRPFRVRSI